MTALFFPTMVSGAETAMVVENPREGGVNVPLMSTTDLEPVLASVTPAWAEHTGADELPVPVVSEHVVVPLVPTYTVCASVAQWPSSKQTPGPTPEHSVSEAHARQVFVAVAQMGVIPEHWALVTHVTH